MDDDSWPMGSTRRQTLRFAAGGAAVLLGGTAGVSAASNGDVLTETDALYVWGLAKDVLTTDAEETRFFGLMDEIDAETVYFSFGSFIDLDHRDERLGSFVETANDDHGVSVELLAGPTHCDQSGIESFRDNYEEALASSLASDYRSPGAIHLDLERAKNDPQPFSDFADAYVSLLDDLQSTDAFADVEVNLDIAWHWGDRHADDLSRFRDHDAVSAVTIMAYADNESGVRRRTRDGLYTGEFLSFLPEREKYTDTPYYVAVDMGKPKDGSDSFSTFWNEGDEEMGRVLQALRDENPPKSFRGTAIHYYAPLKNWH